MKVETNMEPLEVPKSLVRKWKLTEEDCKDKGSISQLVWEEIEKVEGKIISEDEGRFLIYYALSIIPSGGGYPKESSMMVNDIEIVAFGWSSELEEKHHSISMIGLKKKKG